MEDVVRWEEGEGGTAQSLRDRDNRSVVRHLLAAISRADEGEGEEGGLAPGTGPWRYGDARVTGGPIRSRVPRRGSTQVLCGRQDAAQYDDGAVAPDDIAAPLIAQGQR